MTRKYLIRCRDFALFMLAQTLIFSQIHLFGYATAYVCIIFLMKLPRHTSQNELLLWGFIMGIITDIIGNTPGINAASLTFLAFMRNNILESFIQKGNTDNLVASTNTISWRGYVCYTLLCTLLYNTALYFLEVFTINYPVQLLIGVVSSTLLTMLFIIVSECFTRK